MIPQNFKDILTNGENAGIYQSIAMVIFIVFFIWLVIYVLGKSKRYYEDDANAPLNDDN